MSFIAVEIFAVFLLLIINGIFSMSELAVVSARQIRLQQQAKKGNKGAQTAMELAESPNRFLSTVQIGITLVAILSGAFGGAGISQALAAKLEKISFIAPYSQMVAFVIVVGIITYFSIVIGELIPKSLALNSPEKIASLVSRPMKFLSWVASPMVWALSIPTVFFLKVFKVKASVEPPVTDEEIKGLIDAGTKAGVFEETEQDLFESIIHLGDRPVASMMTPRTKINWLDTQDSIEKIKEELINSRYSRLPVSRGGLDSIVGYVSAKKLLSQILKEAEINLESVLQHPLYVPETINTLELLERFKEVNTHFAIVVDEFGGVEGLVTMHDVLEEIVGDFSVSQHTLSKEGVVAQKNGSWLINGQLSIFDFKEVLNLEALPADEEDQYHTVAGFVLTRLGKVPEAGESFEWNNFKFEVVEMDNKRVDKIFVTPLQPLAEEETT